MRRVALALLLLVGLLLLPNVAPLARVARACGVFARATPHTVPPSVPPDDAALRPFPRDRPGYQRPEDQTYLTLPEWYIVYSADEYAAFLTTQRPSQFPYFTATAQYWQSYEAICAVTRTRYPFNTGYHLSLVVTGVSFTDEDTIKGLYEKTVGRLSEALSSADLTAEDAYARDVAREYGAFLHTTPWYEFPFRQRLAGLWRDTPLWGPNPVRKAERKFALSAEYGTKAIYGGLIRRASQGVYGSENLETQLWVAGLTDDLLAAEPDVRLIERFADGSALVAVPRYEVFSQVVPRLTARGVQVREIAGNSELLVTLFAPRGWRYDLPEGAVLASLPLPTDPGQQRVAVTVPVTQLERFLADLARGPARLEHLYDY